MYRILAGTVVLFFMAMSQICGAPAPTPSEMNEARLWAAARFQGRVEAGASKPGLVVIANNDPVTRNERQGRPLNISGKRFTRGLYCHAVSRVIVRLPGPGRTFEAICGVDSNEQTSGGRGSVVFSVSVGGKQRFSSGVMREGAPGRNVSVDLGGAREFMLEVGDAGDGIACDQSDWADARVTMESGEAVWLGDLPITGERSRTYSTEPPFSFVFGGKPSAELLKAWNVQRTSKRLDADRTGRTIVWTDPGTGLQVRCEAVEYSDFPTVEWTVFFKNTGSSSTPILEGVQGLDVELERNIEGEFTLNHNIGSPCTPTDYQPFRTPLGPGESKRITTSGGRPTNSDLPYFNIEWPGEGVIAVLGWPGQWAAQFKRDVGNRLQVTGGQELTRFKLLPGEEVRSPLVVLQFWQGSRVRSQNVWRQWMLAHNMPRPGGHQTPLHMAACSSHQYAEMINTDQDKQIMFVDRYLEEKLPLDYWWMDAGWYVNKTGWPNTGTWEVDTKRFAGGLRAITDHAHAKGVKSIVWFEPERVTPGTWLYETHQEWLLGKDGDQKLLNLGNADAREWLTEHVDGLLKSQGIDLYRQDFNMDPLSNWRDNDARLDERGDRQGITENHHVTGYLAYWDELRRRHPDMLIDTCASGGRRNDIETLRRAVPLLRSDWLLEPTSQQNHAYGMAPWIPLYGTGQNQFETYGFRSCMCPYLNTCYDMRKRDSNYGFVRRMLGDWKRINPYYYGDYYPLTPYSTGNDVWAAWQFDRPDLGEGMVQAFRRPDSIYESARLKLQGLDESASYTVTDLDSRRSRKLSGKELMESGLPVMLKNQPDSAILVYQRG